MFSFSIHDSCRQFLSAAFTGNHFIFPFLAFLTTLSFSRWSNFSSKPSVPPCTSYIRRIAASIFTYIQAGCTMCVFWCAENAGSEDIRQEHKGPNRRAWKCMIWKYTEPENVKRYEEWSGPIFWTILLPVCNVLTRGSIKCSLVCRRQKWKLIPYL